MKELELRIAERNRPQIGPVYRVPFVECPKRCRLDDWLPNLGGSKDCSAGGKAERSDIVKCISAEKGPVHFRTKGYGIDSAFDTFVFRDATGPWNIIERDSDVGGGVNECMAAVFGYSCELSDFNEQLQCTKERTESKHLCSEDAYSVRRYGPPMTATNLRCVRDKWDQLGCFRGGDRGTRINSGAALVCRRALYTDAELECFPETPRSDGIRGPKSGVKK